MPKTLAITVINNSNNIIKMLSIRLHCIYWIPIRLAMVSMTYATAIDFAHHAAALKLKKGFRLLGR